MDLVLIGYMPKRVAPRPEWLKAPNVHCIGSVSECISAGPEDWLSAGRHNECWVFNTEQDAWSVVLGGEQDTLYQMFAYRLMPLEFEDGRQREIEVPELAVQPLRDAYHRLGYDAVARSRASPSGYGPFECSPLSCNGAAAEFAANRFCLADDLAAALELARHFSAGGYEPGPYVVVEVLGQAPGHAVSV